MAEGEPEPGNHVFEAKNRCRLLLRELYSLSSGSVRCCYTLPKSPLRGSVTPMRSAGAEEVLEKKSEKLVSCQGCCCEEIVDSEGEAGKGVTTSTERPSSRARVQRTRITIDTEEEQKKQITSMTMHLHRRHLSGSATEGITDHADIKENQLRVRYSFATSRFRRSPILSPVQQGLPSTTQGKGLEFDSSQQSRRALVEAVRKRLRDRSGLPQVLKTAGESSSAFIKDFARNGALSPELVYSSNVKLQLSPRNATGRGFTHLERNNCIETQYAPPPNSRVLVAPLEAGCTGLEVLLSPTSDAAVTAGILPTENFRPRPQPDSVINDGSELDAAFFPVVEHPLIFPSSLTQNSSFRVWADSFAQRGAESSVSHHHRGPLPLFTLLRGSCRQVQSLDGGDDTTRLRSLVCACLKDIGRLDSEGSEEAINYFFQECMTMCLCPLLAPVPHGNLSLLDPSIRKEFRRLTGCAVDQVKLRDFILAGTTHICIALLESPPPWQDAARVSTWFTRPALFELLTELIDEDLCNHCIGNFIILSAVATALAKAETQTARMTQVDNEVMLLEVALYAVAKMHPKCCNDVERRRVAQTCSPVCVLQIVAIELALEQLRKEATTALLEEEIAEGRHAESTLHTVGGFWRIEMPFALRILTNRHLAVE